MSILCQVDSQVNYQTQAPPDLRDYQQAAVRHVSGTLTRGHRRIWFSLPTGTGKSVILGALAREYLPHGRVVAVAHLRQLIGQLRGHMVTWCGEGAVGVVMAERDEPGADVVVASVQTLSRGRLARILADPRPIAALFIDEFHHATAATYCAFIEAVTAHSPGVVVIGCSATPFRADKAGRNLADLFPTCAFERSIDEMQAAGWLAPLTYQRVVVPMDLADLVFGTRGGERDYAVEALGLEARRPEVVAALVGGTAPYLGDRPALAFCAGVAHAHQLAAAYCAAGVTAAAVDGGMPRREQDAVLDAWRHGEVQVLCQDSLLGEGFDWPPIAALVLAAPTASLVRYVQRLGRGTRLSPEADKLDCLVLEATAGRPDPRQITIGDVLPVADLPPGGGGLRRPQLVLLDPRHDPRWRWLLLADGVYICPADRDTAVWLMRDPEPAGSGLYRAALVEGARLRQLADLPPGRALPIREAQALAGEYLRDHARIALAGRDRTWQDQPATEAQLNAIAQWNPARWRPDLTRGVASEIITVSKLRRLAPVVRVALWPCHGEGVA